MSAHAASNPVDAIDIVLGQMTRDERVRAVVYAMNSLLIHQGAYSLPQLEERMQQWLRKQQDYRGNRRAHPELSVATPARILTMISRDHGVEECEVVSHSTDRRVVELRQMAMYAAFKATKLSLPVIGRIYGGFHHTTVLSSVRKVESRLAHDKPLSDYLEGLLDDLQRKEKGVPECANN